MKTDVLIIGAGPTGLMLANQLNRFGINFIIIDHKKSPSVESRAMSVSSRSMEIYQQLELSDKIISQSKIVKGVKMLNNGKIIANLNLETIGNEFTDFGRLTTTFEQNKNEVLLLENLQEKGKDVLWNHEFVSYSEKQGYLDVILKHTSENSTQTTITSKYLVGCDGAKSAIRHRVGFAFEGGTYENKFYVADVNLTWEYGYENVVMMPEKGVFVAFFPLQEKNKIRVIGTLPKEFEDQENIEFNTLENKMKEVSKIKFSIEKLNWFSTYRVHHRCVDAFSKGNVFLAGDAAHIHSPAGGQGMNTGLQDAHNLGWKMAFVLKGLANPTLLNTYNEERLPYAKSLVKNTDRGFLFISGHNWWIRNLRTYLILPLFGILMKYKAPAVKLFKYLSQLFYSYNKLSLATNDTKQDLKFKAGDRLPFIESGYFKKLISPTFHLIRISNNELSPKETKLLSDLFSFEIKIIEDKISNQWKKFGVENELYILVRPDHHILYVGDAISKEKIEQYFQNYFKP